jgi:radical SAM protein with 4Fe4S-binding SPASM domain
VSLNCHPFCLEVEVTQACPLACPHCYLGKPGTGMMDEATADLVLAYQRREGGYHQAWLEWELNLYGGEPFLNWPIVQYLVKNTPARCTIFTNGATALPAQVEWCQEHGVRPRRSTAGCPEAAALTRPAVGYLNRWLTEGKIWHDFSDTHRLVVTPATAPYVVRSIAWLHSHGYYGPVDLATDDYVAWPPEARRAYEGQLQELAYLVVREFQAGRVLAVENFQVFARSIFGQAGCRVLGCGAGWNTQGVTFDGRVVVCHRAFRESEDSPLCAGRLCDILPAQTADFRVAFACRLADLYEGREETDCLACTARDSCQHGCMHVSHVTRGTLNRQPDARCWAIRLYDRLAREIHDALESHDPKWWEAKATKVVLE